MFAALKLVIRRSSGSVLEDVGLRKPERARFGGVNADANDDAVRHNYFSQYN